MSIPRIFWAGIPIALVGVGIAVVASKRAKHLDHVQVPSFVSFQFDDAEATAVSYAPPSRDGAFVSLTGVGDDQVAHAGFTLTQPMDVRIYSVGEGSGNQMYDFGWIVERGSQGAVWRMEYESTTRAGGADKNRMVDQVMTLQPGTYHTYFMTDGSHSAEDWNASPPLDPEGWGITLIAPEGAAEPDIVAPYSAATDPAILAQLTKIGDSERHSQHFSLQQDSDVRVYALGEGIDGTMHDYAWIEDRATGQTIWKMDYATTAHAGGADKNRLVHKTIGLPAGQYILLYQSDGSHSAEDWNARAPDDPFAWGVTLFKQ